MCGKKNIQSAVVEHEIYCACIFNCRDVTWEICDTNTTILELRRFFNDKYNIRDCKIYFFCGKEYSVFDDEYLVDILNEKNVNALTLKIYTDDEYSIPK